MEAPIRAVTHIQNTAPAPPMETAATTPTMLPMPTRVAVETISAWTPERAPLLPALSCWAVMRSISRKHRTGRNRVRTVK